MHERVKVKGNTILIKILQRLTQALKQLIEDLNYDTKHKLNYNKHCREALSLYDPISG